MVSLTLPYAVYEHSSCSTSLATLGIVSLHFNRSRICKVVAHCGYHLHLSDDKACRASLYVLIHLCVTPDCPGHLSYGNQPIQSPCSEPSPPSGSSTPGRKLLRPNHPRARHQTIRDSAHTKSLLEFFTLTNPKPAYPALPCFSCRNHNRGSGPCILLWTSLCGPAQPSPPPPLENWNRLSFKGNHHLIWWPCHTWIRTKSWVHDLKTVPAFNFFLLKPHIFLGGSALCLKRFLNFIQYY